MTTVVRMSKAEVVAVSEDEVQVVLPEVTFTYSRQDVVEYLKEEWMEDESTYSQVDCIDITLEMFPRDFRYLLKLMDNFE